ncbi:MAG: gliding motility-associated C-terminal domain-containing protein [Chitinophagales bacterium]|nr:gliding motility-associated C-terminal domain-containing protein [Chitinophagales bacterium]
MYKMLCLIAISLQLHTADAQGTWTWLHGDSVTNSNSNRVNRGTKGLASYNNLPPSNHRINVSWRDSSDKFWVIIENYKYGGRDSSEIWSYDWVTNRWTWEAGYDKLEIEGNIPNDFLIYMHQWFLFNIHEYPSWTDSIGNLYFFYEFDKYVSSNPSMIIKFDINTKKFQVLDYRLDYFNYGTKGIARSANWPKFMHQATTWKIGNQVFIFGGSVGNELWEYNMKTGLWTWHGGGINTNHYHSYGTKGISSSANWPPIKFSLVSHWVKGSRCYLHGYGHDFYQNDLWEFNVASKKWTWILGDTIAMSEGSYSNKHCVDSPIFYPAPRIYHSSVMNNNCNSLFWFYGGMRYTSGKDIIYSDLWAYNPYKNNWIWLYGGKTDSSSAFTYGQKGVTSKNNKPPPRRSPAMWTDKLNRLYIFGGYYYTDDKSTLWGTNDLWRYDPDTNCINIKLFDKFIDRNIKYSLCLGDSAVVKVGAGYDSLMVMPSASEASIRTVAGGVEITLKPTTTKSYKIIAYGQRCESQLDSLTVPIVVHQEILNKIDTTICEGQVVRGRTTTGSYADTLTASSGCDSIARLNLTVIPKYLTIDTSICRGKSLYGYTTAGTYYDTLTSSQGCITYRTLRLSIREPSSSTHTQTICEGQSYWGHSTTGTHSDILIAANGCDSTRTLNLTVNKKSYFTLNQEICRGESYEGRSQAGTYLDTFRNAKNCDSIRTLVLTLRTPKIIKKLRDTAICRGSEAILDAGLGHRDYLWSTGEVSPSILVKSEGEYKLSYTDTANCKGRDSAKLKYHNDTEIILQDEISNYKGELLFLNPQIKPSDMGGKYRWTPSYMFQCDSCRTVRFRLDSSAVVRLEFTDAQGCRAYKDVQVNIYDSWAVGFPTAFSPNGDGTNDEYFPNVENILSYNIAIYNRWGEKVYASDNLHQKWDGRYKGDPVPLGSYSYFAEVILLNQDRRTYTGTFHLVR